jgi:hypothetical protein
MILDFVFVVVPYLARLIFYHVKILFRIVTFLGRRLNVYICQYSKLS